MEINIVSGKLHKDSSVWFACQTNTDEYMTIYGHSQAEVVRRLVDSILRGILLVGEYDPEVCQTYDMFKQLVEKERSSPIDYVNNAKYYEDRDNNRTDNRFQFT